MSNRRLCWKGGIGMHWYNHRLQDPVAHDQKWKTTVKPNFATLLIAVLIIILVAIYKPILLLAVVPAFVLIGIVWCRLADRALKKLKKADEPAE